MNLKVILSMRFSVRFRSTQPTGLCRTHVILSVSFLKAEDVGYRNCPPNFSIRNRCIHKKSSGIGVPSYNSFQFSVFSHKRSIELMSM